MAMIKTGVYVGKDYPHLKGKIALVKNANGGGDFAQFDDKESKIGPAWLGFGWHWFAPNSFKFEAESND